MKASDYVEPADYSEIVLSLIEPEVTEDYVDYYIELYLNEDKVSEEVTGRPVQEGDTVRTASLLTGAPQRALP